MGRRSKEEPKNLKVGDYVFAKVRGFRAWPARILQAKGRTYQVYFYGTCNIAKVGPTQLFDFENGKTRFTELRRKKNGLFTEAMEQVKQSIAQPGDDRGYFEAKAQLTAEESTSRKKSVKRILPFEHVTGDSD